MSKLNKPIRSMLINRYDGARVLHISDIAFKELVSEGYIKPDRRKGFYRLGHIIDGHAEAVRMNRIVAPHERATNPAMLACCLTE
ncbi:hypothetical protein [Brucella sp. LJL56]